MVKPVLGGLCLALAFAAPAAAGDPVAGERKSKPCAACHGPDGNSTTPEFPRLAGQHYDYLVKVLQHYQTGQRKNPIMEPLVKDLTMRDIRDLAAFYSRQRGLVTKY